MPWEGGRAAKRSRAGSTGSGIGVPVKIGCMDGRSGRGSAGSGNLALNRLRTLGDRLVVDGFRAFSARPDRGLSLLIRPT